MKNIRDLILTFSLAVIEAHDLLLPLGQSIKLFPHLRNVLIVQILISLIGQRKSKGTSYNRTVFGACRIVSFALLQIRLTILNSTQPAFRPRCDFILA